MNQNPLKAYHLHKDDYSKLQLDINASKPYCEKNIRHCFKPHLHTFFQVIWFKSEGKHFVDYVEYLHPKNAIFFLSEGQVHSFCKDSENSGYLFHFNGIFLNKEEKDVFNHIQYKIFNELGQPFIILSEDMTNDFEYLTEKLVNEIETKKRGYKEQIYHYFQVFLLNIERLKWLQSEQEITPNDSKPDYNFELVMRFKKMVTESKNEFKAVSYFSESLGISDKTLTTISKKYLNETPANFIHKRKILEAKRLLSNTNLSIKEIGYQLGFEEATYFTKYFKKYSSFTPKEFQKEFL